MFVAPHDGRRRAFPRRRFAGQFPGSSGEEVELIGLASSRAETSCDLARPEPHPTAVLLLIYNVWVKWRTKIAYFCQMGTNVLC